MTRVLICGDRNWTDAKLIDDFVATLEPGTVIIEGEARGADRMARDAAIHHGLPYEGYPAQWDRWGRSAGVKRNQEMLERGRPDYVVYFHLRLADSRGTLDMVRRARAQGLKTYDGSVYMNRWVTGITAEDAEGSMLL